MTTLFAHSLLVYLLFILLFKIVVSKSQGECLPVNGDQDAFHCINNSLETKPCQDQHDECNSWARKNECRKNPSYMLSNCRKSCGSCLDLHVGEVQAAPDATHARAILERLVATQNYIYAETERNPQVFRKCKNEHEMCTYWAVLGECDKNAGFMSVSCSAACRKCG